MKRRFGAFKADETGGMTLDWVVLVAALVGVIFGAFTVLTDAADAHAELTANTLKDNDFQHSYD